MRLHCTSSVKAALTVLTLQYASMLPAPSMSNTTQFYRKTDLLVVILVINKISFVGSGF